MKTLCISPGLYTTAVVTNKVSGGGVMFTTDCRPCGMNV